MPRGTLVVTSSARSGTELPAPTTGDPTNGHQYANDGTVMFLALNSGSTVSRTVTVHITKTVDGIPVTGTRTVPVAVGKTALIGPYSPADYGTTVLIDVDNAELKLTAFRSA